MIPKLLFIFSRCYLGHINFLSSLQIVLKVQDKMKTCKEQYCWHWWKYLNEIYIFVITEYLAPECQGDWVLKSVWLFKPMSAWLPGDHIIMQLWQRIPDWSFKLRLFYCNEIRLMKFVGWVVNLFNTLYIWLEKCKNNPEVENLIYIFVNYLDIYIKGE